jgi:hypothetical protein
LLWILLGLLLWGPAGQTSEGPGVFAGLIVLPGYLAVMVTTVAWLVLAQEIGQQAPKKPSPSASIQRKSFALTSIIDIDRLGLVLRE